MSDFKGRLSIIGNQSSLDNDLLLRAGIPDPAQAMFAATQFLVKTRHLSSGQIIIVTGDKGTVGSVGIIAMTDAHAASVQPLTESLFEATSVSPAVSGTKGSKKSATSKGPKKSSGKKSTKGAKGKKSKKARNKSSKRT